MAAISFLLNTTYPLSNSRLPSPPRPHRHVIAATSFGGGNGNNNNRPRSTGGNGNNGNNNNSNSNNHSNDDNNNSSSNNPLSLFLDGWRSRVSADPQFPFKVLMEELVGVSACVLGDMSSRPNFGLNELDFVFSTLVVGSILNFVLMYLLAPTSAISATSPLPSHMFEPGNYTMTDRILTLLYKGAVFAAVGFTAGLAGTAISNGLIKLRKRMDPEFETPNKPPPTLLNAGTWALHMGISSNLRYQSLNGVEYLMERMMPSAGFKVSVLVLRCLNNVLGGASFVLLARLTGSQKVEEKGEGKEKLIADEVAASK